MELLMIVLAVVGLGLLDVLAIRYGADSRPAHDRRPNWW